MREIHVAGPLVALMQRCVRCGEVLNDYRGAMVPADDPRPLGGWQPGAHVEVFRGFPSYWTVTTDAPTCDEVPADRVEDL